MGYLETIDFHGKFAFVVFDEVFVAVVGKIFAAGYSSTFGEFLGGLGGFCSGFGST